MNETLAVPEISKSDRAFPADALDWMPAWDEIPEEYRDRNNGTVWNKIVRRWFFSGLPEKVAFYPKDGVDAERAVAVVQATLGSFAPKHEHKEAACAYMLASWFTKVEHWEHE